jgi:predicted NAD/FAD-binding protein
MRIAIVGAGVSGPVCAHMLRRDHELVIFEAGGHAGTVRVETGTGIYAVDTGFVVFNDRNYPKFERLLGELGVATQPSQNYHLDAEAPGRCAVTYHMNRLQSLRADSELCVTLNRTAAIDPERIIKTIQYAHPVYTPAGVAAHRAGMRGSAGAIARTTAARTGDGAFTRTVSPAQRVAGSWALPAKAGRRGAPKGTTASAIYEDTVSHRRHAVRDYEFHHRLALLYLDLE